MTRLHHPSRRLGPGLLLAALMLATLAAWSQHDWSRGEHDKRGGVPDWVRDEELPHDTFTFTRIQYDSWGGGWRGRGKWSIDYPESDLNLSFRLQQLTALKVDPEGTVLNLTEAALFQYPFIYIIEPGEMVLSEDEVKALRRYLLTGGFLMVDDFWGEAEWENFEREFKRVFPDVDPTKASLRSINDKNYVVSPLDVYMTKSSLPDWLDFWVSKDEKIGRASCRERV